MCSPLWVVPDYNSPYNLTSPAVANGIIYIGGSLNRSTVLNAFNAKTGAIIWSWSSSDIYGFSSSATVANGVVYDATEDGQVYAWNADGCGKKNCSSLWTCSMGNVYTQSSPTVISGYVYIGATDNASPYNGQLFAFRLPGMKV